MTENENENEKYIREHLKEIAKTVETMLPEKSGFILFAFDFGEDGSHRMQYISNAKRSDAFNAINEFMQKVNDENYGKHIDTEEEIENKDN